MSITRYTRRPTAVHALQVSAKNQKSLQDFAGDAAALHFVRPDGSSIDEDGDGHRAAAVIGTASGPYQAVEGDYVVKNEDGSLSVYSAEAFEAEYEAKNEPKGVVISQKVGAAPKAAAAKKTAGRAK